MSWKDEYYKLQDEEKATVIFDGDLLAVDFYPYRRNHNRGFLTPIYVGNVNGFDCKLQSYGNYPMITVSPIIDMDKPREEYANFIDNLPAYTIYFKEFQIRVNNKTDGK